jgi:DNA polymerase I
MDPHLAMGARLLGMAYEDAEANKKRDDVKHARQLAKVANFGFPGGLGAPKLVAFAAKSGVTITEPFAKDLKKTWLEQWPEMRDFFGHVAGLTNNPEQLGTVVQLRSNRIRGGAHYTAACNTYFQGLGADATKHAGWLITKACYTDRTSPLYGSRLVAFVHDEFLLETLEATAHEAAHELSRLMIVGANEWLPDVPFTEVEPLLMRVWSKDAEPIYDAQGRLVPWSL